VARLLDFGQYKYELTKREKEAKRKQRSSPPSRKFASSRRSALATSTRRQGGQSSFWKRATEVKIAVQFRGRELTHPQSRARSFGQGSRTDQKNTAWSSGLRCSRGQVDAHQRRLYPQAEGPRADPVGRAKAHARTADEEPGPDEASGRADEASGQGSKPRKEASSEGDAGGTGAAETASRKPARVDWSVKTVPKMKSHKGAAKRIGVTGSGKAVRVKSWRGHHLEAQVVAAHAPPMTAGDRDRRVDQAGPPPPAVPGSLILDVTRQAGRYPPI